jgi:hypothetical protein
MLKVSARELHCRKVWPKFLSDVCQLTVRSGAVPALTDLVGNGIWDPFDWPPGFEKKLRAEITVIIFIEALALITDRKFGCDITPLKEALEIFRDGLPLAPVRRVKFRPIWAKFGQRFLRIIYPNRKMDFSRHVQVTASFLLRWCRNDPALANTIGETSMSSNSTKCVDCDSPALPGETRCYAHHSK